MRISEIKKNAREALTGKWGKGVSIILANLAVSLVISFIHGLFQENSLISSLLKIAMLIIEVPIALGLAYAFIKLKRGEEVKAFDFLEKLDKLGVKTVICTDISKDGAMVGTNHALYEEMSKRLSLDIIASGGVSTIEDIERLTKLGIYGAIIGKAYYTKAIDLKQAIGVANGN